MFGNERAAEVRRLLFDYVRSPSLRHLRDPHSIDALTKRIIDAVDHEPTIWRKWIGAREDFLRSASLCWIPLEDLYRFLDELPGPRLTLTDVTQRLRAMYEEPYASYPDDALRAGCLALYERERVLGTELPAIVGALQDFVEAETDRLQREHEENRRRVREEERVALEQRFLAGADCKWTALGSAPDLYTRRNGRAYRLAPRKDKRWDLFRITDLSERGALIGTYATRGDASKAVAKLAYEPEPRW